MKRNEYWQHLFFHSKPELCKLDFEELAKAVAQNIIDEKPFIANQYAESAAKQYFIPGLFLIVQVLIAEATALKNEGQSDETKLCAAYQYLIMIRNLMSDGNYLENAQRILHKTDSEIKIDWNNLLNVLNKKGFDTELSIELEAAADRATAKLFKLSVN